MVTPTRSPRQWEAQIKSRLGKGEPAETIVADLVASEVSSEEAARLVQAAREARSSSALKLLIGGLGCAFLGLMVTVGTYSSASQSGGTYFIWYGPMIAGGIAALIAIFRMMR